MKDRRGGRLYPNLDIHRPTKQYPTMIRTCPRESISSIFRAARLLAEAADAHLTGAYADRGRLIVEADDLAMTDWTAEEGGLITPRRRRVVSTWPGVDDWGGLERFRRAVSMPGASTSQ